MEEEKADFPTIQVADFKAFLGHIAAAKRRHGPNLKAYALNKPGGWLVCLTVDGKTLEQVQIIGGEPFVPALLKQGWLVLSNRAGGEIDANAIAQEVVPRLTAVKRWLVKLGLDTVAKLWTASISVLAGILVGALVTWLALKTQAPPPPPTTTPSPAATHPVQSQPAP